MEFTACESSIRKLGVKIMIIKSQSAGNTVRRTSETLRLRSIEYIAGVIDGDGNFDIRVERGLKKLKAIKIKLHIRDVRVVAKVKTLLQCGRLNYNKHLVTWVVSSKMDMIRIVELINGHIRLKVPGFLEACYFYGIKPKQAQYRIRPGSTYLHGLIDTNGSIIYNYASNRIELHLEFKKSNYSEKLDFTEAIPNASVRINRLVKRNQTKRKKYYSIRFSFDTVENMIHLYHFVMSFRLFCDFKFYRISQIPIFLEIRHYKKEARGSFEHRAFSKWVINFISYCNPKYTQISYLNQLTK